jgi:ketosteroid isomerase-like protein
MKKIISGLLFLLLAVFTLSSCSNQVSTALNDADKAVIKKTITDINQAFNASKDYRAYVDAYYAEDATILYPNLEAVKGRDAIIKGLSSFGSDINVIPTVLDVDGRGDLAYVYGTVRMETNAKTELDHGKYIEVWKKQKDGRWQVTYDIFNTSVPMAADSTIKQ